MLYYENKARKQGFQIIIGVDEAGRGPLAGPVVACAVSTKTKKFRTSIRDSKMLTKRQREEAFEEIIAKAHVGIGIISPLMIDRINILQATHAAMAKAIIRLVQEIPFEEKATEKFAKKICILVDGNSFNASFPYSIRTIVRGDQKSRIIACASIVAKVTRDHILDNYDHMYPQYGFGRHKGYPTRIHREAVRTHGLSHIHRQSYHYS